MTDHFSDDRDTSERWAPLRFAVVGPLLAAPPPKGGLDAAITALTRKEWRHPRTGEPIGFGFSTIERWYYRSRNENKDPVGVLRRAVRKDRVSATPPNRCPVPETAPERHGGVPVRSAGTTP